jgi:hypothetical protein
MFAMSLAIFSNASMKPLKLTNNPRPHDLKGSQAR